MSALLVAEGLVKTYPASGGLLHRARSRALDGVSLSVARGETLGIVGESGSGKSTLGRCLLGLTRPDAGGVRFDGADLFALRGRAAREMRRRLQPVFQDPFGSLDPRWPVGRSVREALDAFGIGTRADRARRVDALLERVGLDPALATRLPARLSGGQRQRVAIAAALASEPELIVADEPVSALDMSVQAQILNLFLDLQRDLKVAVVFVTHDLAVVDHIADRIGVMQRGRLVEIGSADDVMRAPRDPYTQALLAAIPTPSFAQGDAHALRQT